VDKVVILTLLLHDKMPSACASKMHQTHHSFSSSEHNGNRELCTEEEDSRSTKFKTSESNLRMQRRKARHPEDNKGIRYSFSIGLELWQGESISVSETRRQQQTSCMTRPKKFQVGPPYRASHKKPAAQQQALAHLTEINNEHKHTFYFT
jgi:hypothetical protein